MTTTFASLGVDARLADSLATRAITEPFPVQSLTIPDALAGRDVAGRAPTGSGKTLAFGLPLVMRLGRAAPRRPRGLVLAPTRELAAQIEAELAPLARRRDRRVASVYGGVSMRRQIDALARGVDVVVACPGRLEDLIQQRAVSLADVDLVVVDEADRMADMGFLPAVKRLLDQVRPDRQTLLYSATLDGAVDELVRRYQRDAVRHDVVMDDEEPDRTAHEFRSTAREDRVGVTAALVRAHGSTIVFCRTRHGADRVARQLVRAGVQAVAIHGDRSQGQRERALAAFTAGRAQALVATDVAARGIHVDEVACVVHFDLPADDKDYVHRSGRTGRAGATGTVVALVPGEQEAAAGKLRRSLGIDTPAAPASPPPAAPGAGPSAGATGSAAADRAAAGAAWADRQGAGRGGRGGGGRSTDGRGRRGGGRSRTHRGGGRPSSRR